MAFLLSLKTFESDFSSEKLKITEIAMKKLKCLWLLSFDLQSWGVEKCGRWQKRSILTTTPLTEQSDLLHQNLLSQRTVPTKHIDTSLM